MPFSEASDGSANPRLNDIPDAYRQDHYPNARERRADQWIHGVSMAFALAGALALMGLAAPAGRIGLVAASALYAAALLAMLGFSALYNLSPISRARPFLRRLDEAGIFVMIAGSYTPFTTQRLSGLWAIGMTALVWTIAVVGAVGKLAFPRMSERVWTLVYVLFGWIAVLAARPLSRSLSPTTMLLLVGGGVVYTVGSLLFLNGRLPFRRAIWHGFVAAAASLHFVAILSGVVLAPA